MAPNLERITNFSPAYDKRDDDPKKNYGIGSVGCSMVLKGPKGAVHFTFGTGMHLPEVLEELAAKGTLVHDMGHRHMVLNEPMGYDVGYHSPTPMWEGQEVRWPAKMIKKEGYEFGQTTGTPEEQLEQLTENVTWEKIGDAPPDCEWLGVPCYCDGSAIRADDWMKIFLREGSEKIWEMLETEYTERFES